MPRHLNQYCLQFSTILFGIKFAVFWRLFYHGIFLQRRCQKIALIVHYIKLVLAVTNFNLSIVVRFIEARTTTLMMFTISKVFPLLLYEVKERYYLWIVYFANRKNQVNWFRRFFFHVRIMLVFFIFFHNSGRPGEFLRGTLLTPQDTWIRKLYRSSIVTNAQQTISTSSAKQTKWLDIVKIIHRFLSQGHRMTPFSA